MLQSTTKDNVNRNYEFFLLHSQKNVQKNLSLSGQQLVAGALPLKGQLCTPSTPEWFILIL